MKTSITFLKNTVSREDAIRKICATDADYIHVDVMDGKFVENKVLSVEEVNRLFQNVNKPLDMHLMCEDPITYITQFKDIPIEIISIHVEIKKDLFSLLNKIKSLGIKAGLAINPDTNIEALNPYLKEVDHILIMGVTPGAGGQKLIPSTVKRIQTLTEIREKNEYHYQISLDGGVNKETRKLLDGLDVIVAGSYVCLSDDFQEAINTLK